MLIPFRTLPCSAFDLSLIVTQYRSSPLHEFFAELNDGLSMLHPDVLALLYHFAAYADGPLLEFGPYVGGSTIAMARGMVDGARKLRIVSVEIGGKYDHPHYPTSDIV